MVRSRASVGGCTGVIICSALPCKIVRHIAPGVEAEELFVRCDLVASERVCFRVVPEVQRAFQEKDALPLPRAIE